METLDKFRSGEITFLAASDVAARGLDIPDVSHVFNYDLPRDSDDYVHRIGRTGRAGKEGFAASLVTREDLGKALKDIEKIIGEAATWMDEAPSEDDYANSGKRRGRGGRGQDARGARDGRNGGGRERAQQQGRGGRDRDGDRGQPRGERGQADLGRGDAEQRQPRAAQLDAPPPAEARRGEPSRDKRRDERRPHDDRSDNSDRSRAERGQPERGERHARPERGGERSSQPQREARRGEPGAPSKPRGDGKRDSGQRDNAPIGFADNIPAFLRRPSRPAKVASE